MANPFMLGIRTDAAAEKLHVGGGNGRADLPFDWIRVADERLKKNVTTLKDALRKVVALRGVRFDMTDAAEGTGEGKHIGFIAQEIEKECPELVSTGANGYKAVAYATMTVFLLEALKEQQAQIERLTARLEALEAFDLHMGR